MDLVKDYSFKNFITFSSDTSLSQAKGLLQDSRYGVAVSPNREPIGILTLSEIEDKIADIGGSPPILAIPQVGEIIVVGNEIEMQSIVSSSFLPEFVNENKNALVIGNSDRLEGILPARTVGLFASKGFTKTADTGISVVSLGGSRTPLTVRYLCRQCGYVNKLVADQWPALDSESGEVKPLPMCQNPDPNVPKHQLKLK